MLTWIEKGIEAQMLSLVEKANSSIGDLKKVKGEMALLKGAIANLFDRREGSTSKIKVLEPKLFNGQQNAEELENFLSDMEQYFKAV